MARGWLLIVPALVAPALAAAAASASPRLAHPAGPPARAVSPGRPMIWPVGAARPGARGGRNAAARSVNWSGYVVGRGAGGYRSVSASWVEPAVTCPAGGGRRYAAFWVGLDGYRGSSVEQTGTDSDCRGRTARYYGWYEMYPAAAVGFAAKVRPGDRVSASVTFSASWTYRLVLRNATRHWTRVIVRNAAGPARASAEVITEAPSSHAGVLPLANFGTVRFTAPRVNGVALRRLAPIRVVMTNDGGQAKDRTSPIGPAGAFRNAWLRSG